MKKALLSTTCFIVIFFASCNYDDPKRAAQLAAELTCEIYELRLNRLELEEELLETYDKEKKRVENPKYGEERWADRYIWKEEIDDWDEHVRVQKEINKIDQKILDVRHEIRSLYTKSLKSAEDQDAWEDFEEEYQEEYDDLIEDMCEDLQEDLQEQEEDLRKKKNNYFDDEY